MGAAGDFPKRNALADKALSLDTPRSATRIVATISGQMGSPGRAATTGGERIIAEEKNFCTRIVVFPTK